MQAQSRFMWLALLTSSSTLLCCALPALLVSLGAGAVLASLVSAFPALIWLTQHKLWLFLLAGVMLAIGGWLQARPAVCPADAQLAKACAQAKKVSRVVYWLSVSVYLVGGFFAYAAPLLLTYL